MGKKARKYLTQMQERTNEQWLSELRGPDPNEALADLHDLLVRGLRAALGGRADGVDANIEDFAQEALIAGEGFEPSLTDPRSVEFAC